MNQMRRYLLIFALVACALAQKASISTGNVQYFNQAGAMCAGCQLATCVAGMTCGVSPSNPQATYTDAGGGTPNSNPVVLDSAGRANIWYTPGLSYKLELYTAGNVLIWTTDNVPGGSLVGTSTVTANFVYAGPSSGAAATPTFRAPVVADIPFQAISCTNQFLSAVSMLDVGTCTTPVLAGAQFANQGTTTTVAHGNAAGNPSWGNVVGGDFGSAIAARSAFGNSTAASAAPAFSSTADFLNYQRAEIPAFVAVASDFTTANNTNLQLITGLTWTIPATTAINVPFVCYFTYNQATANVAVAFGIQDVTVSPTNIAARGMMATSATAYTNAVLNTLTTTTATAIVSATPGATATDYIAEVSGLIEAPSNASSSAINIMVSTAAGADAVTVRRGSNCRMN